MRPRKRKYYVTDKNGKSVEVKNIPKDSPNLLCPQENFEHWAHRQVIRDPFLSGPTREDNE